MRFYEYEAKALFARHGTPLPQGRVARTAAEAKQIAAEIAGPVVPWRAKSALASYS